VTQCVKIVQVLCQCLELVGGHVEHFEGAQLADVWHEFFHLVRIHVQSYQNLRRTANKTRCNLLDMFVK